MKKIKEGEMNAERRASGQIKRRCLKGFPNPNDIFGSPLLPVHTH